MGQSTATTKSLKQVYHNFAFIVFINYRFWGGHKKSSKSATREDVCLQLTLVKFTTDTSQVSRSKHDRFSPGDERYGPHFFTVLFRCLRATTMVRDHYHRRTEPLVAPPLPAPSQARPPK